MTTTTPSFPETPRPKVSVCVVTYNQENTIEKCLLSIIEQACFFDIEIIVGDDCSTDRTSVIIGEINSRYPSIVKHIRHAVNIGAFANYRFVHKMATGDYVAHCDGDDWMLPGKLAKQNNFLDNNVDCSMVAHRMNLHKDDRFIGATVEAPRKFDLNYLVLNHPCFLNSSIMYRRLLGAHLFFGEQDFIDFYVYVGLGASGLIGFVNESLGVYSVGSGISSSRNLMSYVNAAIDLAASYGVNSSDIALARAKQYFSYSISMAVRNDKLEFMKNIEIAKKWGANSDKILLIYRLRNCDGVIFPLIRAYLYLSLVKKKFRDKHVYQ
ncbi:glycosyltransferase family 2 protein [Leptothrix ochracea]|uniref:glycosyltransferase family 2 protein n=1 Tax=Leptothrix ochracea TaxID=735331 RepID=UPI0034E25FE7